MTEHADEVLEDASDVIAARRALADRRAGRGHLVVELGRDRDHQTHGLQVLQAPPERGSQLGWQAVPGGNQRVKARELGHQTGGGLLPYPDDTGQAVRRVTAQDREIDVALWRHAALGLDRRLVEA